jgi:hypothetical protein
MRDIVVFGLATAAFFAFEGRPNAYYYALPWWARFLFRPAGL